jgi:hypothetical protein
MPCPGGPIRLQVADSLVTTLTMLRMRRWREEGWFNLAVITMQFPGMTPPDLTVTVDRISSQCVARL